ncbi:hypothetical protein KEJ49_03595 [Candidatus Bathyarchaeota archaeon]|nr:hypothetical protein [Candidatus Bathyarchaeota archaeon]
MSRWGKVEKGKRFFRAHDIIQFQSQDILSPVVIDARERKPTIKAIIRNYMVLNKWGYRCRS